MIKTSSLAYAAAAAAALVLAVFWAYGPALPDQSLVDDDPVALHNGAVIDGQPSFAVAPYYSDLYRPLWRPLATLSLRLDRLRATRADELSPADLAHIHQTMLHTSLLLVALAAFLIYLLFHRLGVPRWGAAAAAGVLLLHPANSQSVWMLAGRGELLAAVLILGALLVYVSAVSPARSRVAAETDQPLLHSLHCTGTG